VVNTIEPKSKLVVRKGEDLYIDDLRVNVYTRMAVSRMFGKQVEELTDEEVKAYRSRDNVNP